MFTRTFEQDRQSSARTLTLRHRRAYTCSLNHDLISSEIDLVRRDGIRAHFPHHHQHYFICATTYGAHLKTFVGRIIEPSKQIPWHDDAKLLFAALFHTIHSTTHALSRHLFDLFPHRTIATHLTAQRHRTPNKKPNKYPTRTPISMNNTLNLFAGNALSATAYIFVFEFAARDKGCVCWMRVGAKTSATLRAHPQTQHIYSPHHPDDEARRRAKYVTPSSRRGVVTFCEPRTRHTIAGLYRVYDYRLFCWRRVSVYIPRLECLFVVCASWAQSHISRYVPMRANRWKPPARIHARARRTSDGRGGGGADGFITACAI